MHQAELLPVQGLQRRICKVQTSFVIIRDSVLASQRALGLSLAKVLQGQCKRGAVSVLTMFLFLGSQAVFPHDSASEVSQTGMRPHPDDAGPVCATSNPTMPITQQSNHADQPTGDLTMPITKQNNHANQQSTVPINQQSNHADQPTGDRTMPAACPSGQPRRYGHREGYGRVKSRWRARQTDGGGL